MTNRKLIKTQAGEFILSDLKGNQFICPYQNAILVPGNLQGQLIINRPGCSSACSLFHMEQVPPDKIRITKNCCPGHDVEVLEVDSQDEQSPKSPILQG